MPYPNEHAARLLSPGTEHIRIRRTKGSGAGTVQGAKIPGTVDVIWYVVRGSGGEMVPRAQALRFPTRNWTAEQAKSWLGKNNIKVMLFEPAAKQ
ncbi:MAG: hypothetical protein KAT00_15520 [Planctomycetes bacterium]|nr:hypothetical protein [Planctomycetota bacterium]